MAGAVSLNTVMESSNELGCNWEDSHRQRGRTPSRPFWKRYVMMWDLYLALKRGRELQPFSKTCTRMGTSPWRG